MKTITLIVVTLLMQVNALAQTARISWQMACGDPAHTSYAEINLGFPLQLTQTLSPGHDWENGVAISEDHVFIADYGDPNTLVVADLNTGQMVWEYGLPGTGGGMSFVPAVAADIVLVGGQSGKGLYAFDVWTGDSLWLLPVKGLYGRPATIDADRVYIAGSEGLVCADLQSGQPHWSFDDFVPQQSPVVDAQNVYFNTFDFIYALDKVTGDMAWMNTTFEAQHWTSYAVDSQYLFVGYDTMFAALNKSTGEVEWSVVLPENSVLNYYPSAFAMKDQYLLVKIIVDGAAENRYLLLDKETGTELTSYPAQKSFSAPTIINDYVVEYLNGHLRFLDLVSGALAYEMTALSVGSSPTQVIAANDKIYVTGNGPHILVLEGTPSVVHDASASLQFGVFPNPVQEQLQCTFTLHESSTVRIGISQPDGMRVWHRDLGTWNAGDHTVVVPVPLPAGLYFLQLQTEWGSMTQRIVVHE